MAYQQVVHVYKFCYVVGSAVLDLYFDTSNDKVDLSVVVAFTF